jgi:hypothetical protein
MKQIIAEIKDVVFAMWFGGCLVFMVLSLVCAPFHYFRKNPKLRYYDPTDGVPRILMMVTLSFLLLGTLGGILAIPVFLVAAIVGVR